MVFVAASTRCFSDLPFEDACHQLSELEYDKVEIWVNESSDHLKPAELVDDVERFAARYREQTRLTPIALTLAHDVSQDTFLKLTSLCKILRIMQITIPASPLGTPFNTEIDRLRAFQSMAGEHGIRVSLKTESGCLTADPHTAVELCQSVKGLGITLDPSYYICGAPENFGYDQVFPYVYHMQLRDTSPEEIQVPVGLGVMDYYRLITQLEQEKYQRALSVEFYPEKIEDLEQRPLEMRKIRMLLDTLL